MHTPSKEAQNNDRGFVYTSIQPSYIRPYIAFLQRRTRKSDPSTTRPGFIHSTPGMPRASFKCKWGMYRHHDLSHLDLSSSHLVAKPCPATHPTQPIIFSFFVPLHGSRRPFRKRNAIRADPHNPQSGKQGKGKREKVFVTTSFLFRKQEGRKK
jgi:hypothetical protein